ncbi:MAG TPA: hypothetical protein VNK44_07330 [Candidatus Nitrosotenuis sp.]|nr:hypothetical protein [Candidatus Nitrosotenuis sp.]
MQTTLDVVLSKKYLIAALSGIAIFNAVSNLIGKDFAIFAGNLAYIPVAGSFLVLTILILIRFGTSGMHGIAWVSFGGYAISWFIAEVLWIVQELYLKINPFPSAADIFYLVGYPFLIIFFIAYLQPMRSAITRKMIVASSAFAIGILGISMYSVFSTTTNDDVFELVLATIYPVFDAVIIIPALIGVGLFFKGHVNLMWTLLCLGSISVFAADTAFLLAQNEESYYTGNPMEILFYWNYVLLAFGVHNHLNLFRTQQGSKLEDLR